MKASGLRLIMLLASRVGMVVVAADEEERPIPVDELTEELEKVRVLFEKADRLDTADESPFSE